MQNAPQQNHRGEKILFDDKSHATWMLYDLFELETVLNIVIASKPNHLYQFRHYYQAKNYVFVL